MFYRVSRCPGLWLVALGVVFGTTCLRGQQPAQTGATPQPIAVPSNPPTQTIATPDNLPPLAAALGQARDEERWWVFLAAVRTRLPKEDHAVPPEVIERTAKAEADVVAWAARLRAARDAAPDSKPTAVLEEWTAAAPAIKENRRKLILEYASFAFDLHTQASNHFLAPDAPVTSLAGPQATPILLRSYERGRDEDRWWAFYKEVLAKLAERRMRFDADGLMERSIDPIVNVNSWVSNAKLALTVPRWSEEERLDDVAKYDAQADKMSDTRRKHIREFADKVLGVGAPALQRLDADTGR